MSVDLYFTGIFLSYFFTLWFPSLLNGTQPYPATWSGVFENVCPKSVVSLPLQIRGPCRFCNLRATLTSYIFGMKHNIHKWASVLQTTRSLLYHLKTTWTLGHKRLQIGGEFSPTLCEFCIPLHCQALQTEISRWNSTKLCQTSDSNSR